MDIIVTKNHEMFGKIRILEKDGEPWFVLADVCKALDIGNPSMVLERLNSNGLSKIEGVVNSGLGEQIVELNIINEMNLYKCILRSNKPEAEKFQDWVCGEILPAIRKHGMYAIDDLLDNPDYLIKALTQLKIERAARKLADEMRLKEEQVKRISWSSKGGIKANRNYYKNKTEVLEHENDLLREELGFNKDWATVKKMEIYFKQKFPWKPLKDYSKAHGTEIRKVHDVNYSQVNCYHWTAWRDCYGIKLKELFY
jgi:prophage antirepressor-like protein